MGFVHLHVHTEHSVLDGLTKTEELFARVTELGQPAVAVTDHGSLGAVWKGAKFAAKHGVKFIAGLEAYLAIGSRFARETITVSGGAGSKSRVYEHVTLLAKSRVGWANLVRLHNESAHHRAGSKGRLIDYELLAAHGEGLIVLTGCLGGPVLGPLSRGEVDRARTNLSRLVAAVGSGNVFVELMEHGIAEESAVLPQAVSLAEEFGLQVVATNDTHYTFEGDAADHSAWLALQTRSTLATNKYHFHGHGYHVRSEAEMRALRSEPWWQVACDNSVVVAGMVEDRVLPEPENRLPVFPTPEGFESAYDFFVHLVHEGLALRYPGGVSQVVADRANHEIEVIRSLGFVDYFLITRDMIVSEQEAGGLVGPGRGSAAGSLVAFLLGITQVDPLVHGLLFERFLEPGRSEFPDIDVDFESARRPVVLDRLKQRWGDDRVAQLGAPGMIKAKAALRDAARVLGLSSLGDQLARTVPDFVDLEVMVGERSVTNQDFLDVVGSHPASGQLVSLALKFNNTVRQYSSHASGVVVSSESLMGLVPLRRDTNKATGEEQWVTEWDMNDVQELGLVKFDVLAIRNLDMAAATMRMVAERTGEQLSLYGLPSPDDVSDPRVVQAWQLLSAGRTAGVFQMESDGMTRLLQEVQPSSWGDLSAVVALFRPGPLSAGMHTAFANRKNGRERVSYSVFTDDPVEQEFLASVMGDTFATFVYQEQVMALGRVVAGFDDVWRSKLRKAVSKKNADLMAEVGGKFLEGAGVEFVDPVSGVVFSPVFARSTAEKLWAAMQGSAEYLFNKSHSMAYALVAFHTAFLKANWPAEYGAATLSVTDGKEKRLTAFSALRSEGVRVLPPSVNESGFATATTSDGLAVRVGLGEISGVGDSVQTILVERERGGRFVSLGDLFDRVRGEDARRLDSGTLDALIGSGALDEFGPRYGMLMVSRALRTDSGVSVPQVEFGGLERAARQRSLLGVFCDYHPAELLRDVFSVWRTAGGVAGVTVSGVPGTAGEQCVVLGVVSGVSVRDYSRGKLCKLSLEDESSSIDCVMFDDVYRRVFSVVPGLGFPVAVAGRVQVSEFVQGDDGEVVRRVELVVSDVFPVPVSDPPVGSLMSHVFDRVDLTGGVEALVELPELVPVSSVEVAEFFPDDSCVVVPDVEVDAGVDGWGVVIDLVSDGGVKSSGGVADWLSEDLFDDDGDEPLRTLF